MKILVKKHFGKLVPVYNSDAEALKDCKLKENEVYQVEITKPRNYEFHKKYFALLNLCFDNQDKYTSFEDLREEIIIEAGYYREINDFHGIPKKKALSISFSNMDEIEFGILYRKTIDVICRFIDVEAKDIIDEIVNYL